MKCGRLPELVNQDETYWMKTTLIDSRKDNIPPVFNVHTISSSGLSLVTGKFKAEKNSSPGPSASGV